MERMLFVLQRVTAVLLAGMVVVHIAVILYASAGSLSVAEILGRTRGNVAFAAFYGLFVAAAAVHAPIGLRNVLHEWTPLPRVAVDIAMAAFAATLVWLGGAAVHAVFTA